MNQIKAYVSFLLIFTSLSVFADLEDGASPKLNYHSVAMYELKSVKLRTKFYPRTATRLAHYKGSISFNLVVEGNICADSPSTFGTKWLWTEDGSTLSLLTGAKKRNEAVMCAQYSKPTTVVVKENVDLVKYDESPVTGKYLIKLTDQNSTVKIVRISESGNKLIATIE